VLASCGGAFKLATLAMTPNKHASRWGTAGGVFTSTLAGDRMRKLRRVGVNQVESRCGCGRLRPHT